MPQPMDYKERMNAWVEDHMAPIKEGSHIWETVGILRSFRATEDVITDYLWSYALSHSDEVMG